MKMFLSQTILSLVCFTNLSAAVLTENFQSTAVGAIPAGTTVNQQNLGQVVVVGSATGDPFGPSGNHSLKIDKPITGTTSSPRITWELSQTVFNGGLGESVSFDLYSATAATNKPYLAIFLYQGDLSHRTITLSISATTISLSNGSLTLSTANQAWVENAANHISINNLGNQKYQVLINNSPITIGSGPTLTNTFNFLSGESSFNKIQFAIADNSNLHNPFYMDNLVVVPEPSTLIFGAFGLGAITILRRRNKA